MNRRPIGGMVIKCIDGCNRGTISLDNSKDEINDRIDVRLDLINSYYLDLCHVL